METKNAALPQILAVDTSAGRSSVVVWKDGVIAQGQDETTGQQSRLLVPLIESVLKQAGTTYEACTAFACALGPGGFTSVRVGVASMRAAALAAGKPLMGINALEAIAFSAGVEGDVAVAIDAHRGQFYAQRFRINGVPEVVSPEMLAEESGVKALAHGAKLVTTACNAEAVAKLADAWWRSGRREFPVDPLYIREPDAKLPA